LTGQDSGELPRAAWEAAKSPLEVNQGRVWCPAVAGDACGQAVGLLADILTRRTKGRNGAV
jgi:hypothetical protein